MSGPIDLLNDPIRDNRHVPINYSRIRNEPNYCSHRSEPPCPAKGNANDNGHAIPQANPIGTFTATYHEVGGTG
jgi:hypothetical protein